MIRVQVQTGDFDLGGEAAAIAAQDSGIGGVTSFVGLVRAEPDLISLTLEHYPGMTENALEEIVSQAKRRWDIVDALVIHRVGPLRPLDQIVLVAVASAHRGDAFAACEFIIDYLKMDAPFWKKEQTAAGARWVDARVADAAALEKVHAFGG